ncbi:MAG: phosphodiester glycosidase family protein [Planctomycetota bacterium]
MTITCLTLAAIVAPAIAQPITVTEIDRRLQGRDIRGFVAVIDLTDPRVETVVTEPAPAGTGAEAVLTRTDLWQQTNDVDLAINANFYGTLPGGLADIVGLSVSDGQIISGARVFENSVPDPSLMIRNDGMAVVGNFSNVDAQQAEDAIAGVGPSNTDNDPGSLLLDDGQNLGSTARVQPGVRNPRTAAGVSQDGNTLILMVIDGRQPGWSDGVTLPQMGDLMIEFGAWDAINLDGGGSSAFIYDDGTSRTTNRPSDGQFRAVANHFGVRINQPPAPDAETRRKIRGIWLRPPTTIAALDSTLATLKDSGIRDVFLETFYWGLATNDSDIFQDRFAFDYLEQAIPVAAKHGMRVHAWMEAAYWSFNGTGDYILDANPDWKVTDYLGNTDIGDIPGQVFVNIGLPEVQQMLQEYCAEVAAYPGLWGVHTDYHRFPLDNDLGDGQPGPYSYDFDSRLAFFGQFGVDPLVQITDDSDPLWDQWVQFRRDRIALAAKAMNDGVNAVNPEIQFSGAIFAQAITSSSQLVKMQDWPQMAANGWLEYVVPMAYGTSTASIRNDLQIANADKGPSTIVAGLAILTNQTRPSIGQQLSVAIGEGIEDWVLFEGNTLAGSASMRDELRAFLLGSATFQSADFNLDMDVDARDWTFFEFAMLASPNPPVAGFEAADLNHDGFMTEEDRTLFRDQFREYRFGADGVTDSRDLEAFLACFTGPGPGTAATGVLNVYDLDGDGVVDYDDQLRLHALLTEPVPFDFDVDRDGAVSIDDLYRQNQSSLDVNRDGVIDVNDTRVLEAELRKNEFEILTTPVAP